MKIAILSMQRVINYGSFLQAYSLKRILENRGHTVTFIDIKDKNGSVNCFKDYKDKGFMYYVKMMYRKIFHTSAYCAAFKREHLFHTKLFKELGLSEKYDSFDKQEFDLCIIGSDEVFNCCQDAPWEGSMHLFGEGINAKKIISYAASFGHTTITDIQEKNIYDFVKNCLRKLDAISVRDKNSAEIVEEMTGKAPLINIDPVFLSTYKERIPTNIKDKNYILIYGYDERICEQEIITVVKKFAKQHNKKIIALGMAQSWCDSTIVPDPFELLAYFENADYIVTDTFHGTVFSIKYQKQFVTIIRESNQEKLLDLLETFDLRSREVFNYDDIPKVLLDVYNKETVRKQIQEKKNVALGYLEKFLGADE